MTHEEKDRHRKRRKFLQKEKFLRKAIRDTSVKEYKKIKSFLQEPEVDVEDDVIDNTSNLNDNH